MTDASDLLGPIDYLVIEFPGNQFNGEVIPALVRLIADGTVRILDLAFIMKDASGDVVIGEIEDLGDDLGPLSELAEFLVDLLSEEDLVAAAEELAPNSSAAFLVWENTWAAPFASAVRGSGGEVIASGRIPSGDVIALLDAAQD